MEYLKSKKYSHVVTIFTAPSKSDAKKLYEAGANFVTLPEVLAGEYIVHLFNTYGFSQAKLKSLGEAQDRKVVSLT
jgi:Trk K+ transport system NAD-binding subunit